MICKFELKPIKYAIGKAKTQKQVYHNPTKA